jgi:hypothetical protein
MKKTGRECDAGLKSAEWSDREKDWPAREKKPAHLALVVIPTLLAILLLIGGGTVVAITLAPRILDRLSEIAPDAEPEQNLRHPVLPRPPARDPREAGKRNRPAGDDAPADDPPPEQAL